jgi:sulfide:quinone oxidoreductase
VRKHLLKKGVSKKDKEGEFMGKKVVILGGGMGGLVVANQLRRKLTLDNEIVLIDKEKSHLFTPSLLWLMVGWRDREDVQKPLSLLQRKGINFIHAYVQKIDFDNQIVFTSKGDVLFDYLVIALGARTFPEKIPGFVKGAYNLYELSGVERIRETIENFDKGRIIILITSESFKCPAAPYEAALLLSAYFTKKGRDVEIEVFAPHPLPMGVAGPEVGKMVVSLLQSRRIRFVPQHQAVNIDSEKREIVFQDEKTISYDLLIGIPPHGLPPVLKDSPVLGESGWVKVNPRTLETKVENVYAVGDVTSITLPVGKSLPKAGVFAHYQGEVIAHNLAAKISSGSGEMEFDGRGYCFIELGDGKAGFASGNFYVEPKPVVRLKKPSRMWHWGKVLFEKWWFWKWF